MEGISTPASEIGRAHVKVHLAWPGSQRPEVQSLAWAGWWWHGEAQVAFLAASALALNWLGPLHSPVPPSLR